MTNEDYVKQFWEEGYLHIPGFFDSDQMDQFNDICLKHYGLDPKWEHTDEFIERSNCEIVVWFPLNDEVNEFKEIDKNPNFAEITTQILGEGWKDLYCMSMFSKKGTKGQAWHQDCTPEDPDQFNLNRLVYTHDITDEIGGEVMVVPGSHKRGIIPVGDPEGDFEGQIKLVPKKGDAVFLHGHTWHRVLDVRGKYRVSTNYRAMSKHVPDSITDYAIYRNIIYHFPTKSVTEERMK